MSWIFGVVGAATRRLPRPVLNGVYRVPGLARLGRSLFNTAVTSGVVEVQVAGGPLEGAWLVIDSRCEKSLWLGTYEPWVQERLGRLLQPGSVAWDVGAYSGYHTVLMSRIVGDGAVVAFEPDEANRRRLRRAVELNGLTNVEVVARAVDERPGSGRSVRTTGNAGATRIVSGPGPCRVVTLDDSLDELPGPSLVKMDIEGAEFGALRGGTRLLHDVRPVFILELHGEPGRDAVDLLRAAGYRVERLGKGVDVREDHPVGGPEHVLAVP